LVYRKRKRKPPRPLRSRIRPPRRTARPSPCRRDRRELKALRDSVSGVTSWKTQQEQQAANQRRAIEIEQENAVSNQVNEFKSAVDDKGSPLHPHFDEVEAMMTSLAQAALASKQPVPSAATL